MLTDTAIRKAVPSQKTTRLFDGDGLYLEFSPAGGKWWRLKYRFAGKEKRLSLGVYPDVSLKATRGRRHEARKLLSDGVDPSEHRKALKSERAERAANSFEVITREWYAKYSPNWALHHRDRLLRRFERDIFPCIGGRPIAELSAPELLAVVRRIEGRGALETAHRALGNCGQVFRATPWRLDARSVIPRAIYGVRCPQLRVSTSPRLPIPCESATYSGHWTGIKER